jgi:DNA-binding CsgD family transcriptional regulator
VVRTLELLALGEPLRLEDVLELTGSEPLQEAEARGLVQTRSSADGGEVRLAHPVYGDVIEARMLGMRARAARLRLAEIVGRRAPRSPDDALRIARWLLDAGQAIGPDLLVEAARAANRAGDPDLGARLAGLALEADASVEAALLLARAHSMRHRYAEADAVLAGVEDALDTQELGIEYLIQRMGVLFWGLERPQDARALLGRASDWWDDGVWSARLQAMDLQVATLSEGFAGSAEASDRLLVDSSLSERTRLRLLPVHLANLFYSGRAREAYALSLRLRPPVPLPHQSDEYTLMMCSIVAAESGEDWTELRAWLTDTVQVAVRHGDHFAAGLAATNLGFLDTLAGRLVDAQRWLAEAEAQLERHDALGTLIAARLFAADTVATIGDAETAGAMLAKVERSQPGPMTSPLKAHLARARARRAIAEGDLPAAQDVLLGIVEEFANMPPVAAKLLYEAMRCGAPARGLIARIELLRGRCDSRMVEAYADHVAARAAGDAAGLLRSSDAFAAIGADLLAMEAAAHAATAFAAKGRKDSARRAAARSLQLHARGQGGPAPAIVGVESADVMLTRRETELVALAAHGMSNAEIADRLVLSIRTVESHLYRAMQKLGVSDRREL